MPCYSRYCAFECSLGTLDLSAVTAHSLTTLDLLSYKPLDLFFYILLMRHIFFILSLGSAFYKLIIFNILQKEFVMAYHESKEYNKITKLSILKPEPSKPEWWDNTPRKPRLKEASKNEFLDSLSQNWYERLYSSY